MFLTIRRQFRPSPAAIIAVVALVFAMVGGAFAASSGGSGSDAVASKAKGKRGPTGPRGKKGATGPAGPAGPQGPAGANGKDGLNGVNGATGDTGAQGIPGTSVTNTAIPVGNLNCQERGGAEFKVGSGAATFACNGKEGPEGPLLDVTPQGRLWTGGWAVSINSEGDTATSISYPFPLEAPPAATWVIKSGQEGIENAEDCPGSFAEPDAKEGVLCFYTGLESEALNLSSGFAATTAGMALFTSGGTPGALGIGTWAVRAG